MGVLLVTVPYAINDLGISPVTAALLSSNMGICELVLRIPFGWLGDWEKINRTILLGATFLALGLLFFMFPFCTNFLSLMIFAGMSGFFQVN